MNTMNTMNTQNLPASRAIWLKRLIVALTIIAWIAIGCFLLFVASLVGSTLELMLIGGLIAYLIYPLVQVFRRAMPRFLAVTLVYVVLLIALSVLIYIVSVSFVQQLVLLVRQIMRVLSPEGQSQISPLLNFLQRIGISKDQFVGFGDQFASQLQGLVSGLLPAIGGLFNWIIIAVVIATLSVYFILDGPRGVVWFKSRTPKRSREAIAFLVSTVNASVGGYFRGLLILAIIAGIGAGVFLALVGNSFAVLLGVIVFALFFIPMVGGFASGLLCIIFAIPQGWLTALIVGIYIVTLQTVILGSIIEPRVFSHTVGVHPILVIFAIFAGIERFGILGALLAVPVVSVLQQILLMYWKRYQTRNPEQFLPDEVPASEPEHRVEKEEASSGSEL
jgi:putative heme transporter